MTIINSKLIRTLYLQYYDILDIPIASISSKYISSKFIKLPIFFYREYNLIRITVEAYLVDNLYIKLLLRIDAIGYKGFRINIDTSTIYIASYIGFTFPVSIYAKPRY